MYQTLNVPFALTMIRQVSGNDSAELDFLHNTILYSWGAHVLGLFDDQLMHKSNNSRFSKNTMGAKIG